MAPRSSRYGAPRAEVGCPPFLSHFIVPTLNT